MKFTVFILTLLVLFMLAGVLPVAEGTQAVVFHSPVFIGLLVLLGVAILYCCVRRRPDVKQIGFYLVHLGVVVILAGAGIGYIAGQKTSCAIPIAPQHEIRELPRQNAEPIMLDFSITVPDFSVEYYDPSYYLYRPVAVTGEIRKTDYEFVENVSFTGDEPVPITDVLTVSPDDLKDGRGNWVPQQFLENGWVLQKGEAMPRHYSAQMNLKADDSDEVAAELSVNHPVSFAGWRFYLMSYDQQNLRYIVISARHDPGRLLVICGIWAVIVGIAVLCFRKKGVGHGTS
jgi:hypothetical protein